MTRTWVIPMSLGIPETKIELREPPLTGDWLGLKTWGTSYVISKKLEHIGTEYLAHLHGKSSPGAHQVLELGAGTGLVSPKVKWIVQSSLIEHCAAPACERDRCFA